MSTSQISPGQQRIKVWYDGACPMCQREIALMRRLDTNSAIAFVDVADKGDPACPIDQSRLLERFHAEEDGQIVSGAAAFAAMWRAIPRLRWLGLIARNQAMLRILEWLYVQHLKIRPQLQRLFRKLD
ncbi:DUF393 domain-containing protein [Erythrobacter insulae]|uniref:DUF393 domain-containing protein n=1 Tax=Erythrobacter insulae TaxID=2584124 RepID=A0A547PDB6_9SPHN|nr:DUF393 domain-containing protein [Erythrobacter insulae]TRD12136.1 DUF393 domain-containing protein [Erythrobacter insulae]